MQLSDLRIITVLAAERNMRRAAERLFVSQPALSQRLQSIEAYWGTKLFIRSKRGLVLTSSGEQIVSYAEEMIQKEEEVKEQLSTLEPEIYGTLKLAVASITGQYWLPPTLKKFVRQFPLVKISLMTGWSSEVLRHMYEDTSHIGIIRGDPKWRGHKVHLFSDELYLVDTEMASLEELKTTKKPYIQFKSDSSYYQEIQDWWHIHYKSAPKRTIVVDQIETCKQMAMNGIGYAILPSISLTEKDEGIYKIPLIDKNGEQMKRDTWLLMHEEVMQLKQVKAFLNLFYDDPSVNLIKR